MKKINRFGVITRPSTYKGCNNTTTFFFLTPSLRFEFWWCSVVKLCWVGHSWNRRNLWVFILEKISGGWVAAHLFICIVSLRVLAFEIKTLNMFWYIKSISEVRGMVVWFILILQLRLQNKIIWLKNYHDHMTLETYFQLVVAQLFLLSSCEHYWAHYHDIWISATLETQ